MADGEKLGETDKLLELNARDALRDTALAMAAQAERHIYIFSHDLDHFIYDNPSFVEACSELARAHRRSEIRVLTRDSNKVVKQGHKLVLLGQRLASSIHFRVPLDEYNDHNESFMVVDDIGYLYRPLHDRFEGEANFSNRLKARDLGDFFREVWERSQPDPQLRRLQI